MLERRGRPPSLRHRHPRSRGHGLHRQPPTSCGTERTRRSSSSRAARPSCTTPRDAAGPRRELGLRHFKISPGEATGREDARRIVRDLAAEFGFDEGRAVIVEHRKPRAGGTGFDHHWHALVPEVDPVSGRVLDASWIRPRHEKLARLAEDRLGHAPVPGRWNAAVARALAAGGHPALARRVAAAAAAPRPGAAYTTARHQAAARRGHDLPADRRVVAAAWRGSDGPHAFLAALAGRGISVRPGDRPGTWIAARGGNLLGAVHRLTGASPAEIQDCLAPQPAAPRPAAPTLPRPPVRHRWVARVPMPPGRPGEDAADREAGRRGWLAAAAGGAYRLDWLPGTVAARVAGVRVEAAANGGRGVVILTLGSGTRLVDRWERLDVVGLVDDVTVAELAEAVRRRGWASARVEGPEEFRQAMTRRLARLAPPVAVPGVEPGVAPGAADRAGPDPAPAASRGRDGAGQAPVEIPVADHPSPDAPAPRRPGGR